jgi:predicted dehydrogenase
MDRLRIAVAGCGVAARAHTNRLARRRDVRIVALADPDLQAAQRLAEGLLGAGPGVEAEGPTVFGDHVSMLRAVHPDALAVFTPYLHHFRVALDGLLAGCHVFVEKPLCTNVQEATDLVNVARARDRILAVGHQYRLRPTLKQAKQRLAEGRIGRPRLAVGLLAQPWLAAHAGGEDSWRFDPRIAGSGILTDSGDHLLDTLLWVLGTPALEATAIQDRLDSGLDVVTAAAVKLAPNLPATLAVSGVSAGSLFELTILGETGALRVSETLLQERLGDQPFQTIAEETSGSAGDGPDFQVSQVAGDSIDDDFVEAARGRRFPSCPGDQALGTVKLLEAIVRSAATGRPVAIA